MGEFIPIIKPWMDEREAAAAGQAIMSGWVTQGPQVAEFEKEFAQCVGAERACAVSSCTAALHLALLAAGVRPGDEVITVSHSYIATANTIRYCGATPVFVDIQPQTYNIDPERIEEAITKATRAILCVHQMGLPCDLRAVLEIAERHSLPVVEDAACAIGSEILWQGAWERVGKPHGDVACFSFHPRKIVTTGDGGMITTVHAQWDEKFRRWRQHSMSVPDTVRHKARQIVVETYPEMGYNYRLTDIQAAVGREQLKRLPEIIARRRSLAARYGELLSGEDGLRLPTEPAWARTNWQSYCVALPAGCDQKSVMQAMLDAGVATRRGIMCAHREPVLSKEPWSCGAGPGRCGCPAGTCARLTAGERAQDASILLPLYHHLTESDQDRVVSALRRALHQPDPG